MNNDLIANKETLERRKIDNANRVDAKSLSWFEERWVSAIPIIMLTIFIGFYVLAQYSFVESKIQFSSAQCKPELPKLPEPSCAKIDPNYIFVSAPDVIDANGNLVEDEQPNEKPTYTSSRQTITNRYSGRLIAMFLLLANVLFCFIALFVFFFLIKKSLGNKFAIGFIAVSLLIGFASAIIDPMPLLEPILSKTIEKFAGGMAGIVYVIKGVNSIAYAATLAFVFTICSILYSKYSTKENITASEGAKENTTASEDAVGKKIELNKKFQEISNEKKNLEIVLYICTILLIVGVLRMNVLSSWSLTFMTTETIEIAKTFFVQITTVIGGFFTLLLIITYLPATYILQQREKTLLEDFAVAEIELPETSKETDFTFSLTKSLPKIIAIAAPLLTEPVAELLKNLLQLQN